MHIYIYIQIYVYMCVHIYMYIYIYIYINISTSLETPAAAWITTLRQPSQASLKESRVHGLWGFNRGLHRFLVIHGLQIS